MKTCTKSMFLLKTTISCRFSLVFDSFFIENRCPSQAKSMFLLKALIFFFCLGIFPLWILGLTGQSHMYYVVHPHGWARSALMILGCPLRESGGGPGSLPTLFFEKRCRSQLTLYMARHLHRHFFLEKSVETHGAVQASRHLFSKKSVASNPGPPPDSLRGHPRSLKADLAQPWGWAT